MQALKEQTMSEFTHFDAAGNALMVDVSDKADTARAAVAHQRADSAVSSAAVDEVHGGF